MEAKALIHDAFAQQLMPVRFLPYVSSAYFNPTNAEFEPRTLPKYFSEMATSNLSGDTVLKIKEVLSSVLGSAMR